MGIDRRKAAPRPPFGLAVAAMALAPVASGAKELTSPHGVFIEGGISDDSRSVVGGVAWTWGQPSTWGGGNASGYVETSIGEWACHRQAGDHYHDCSTQVGPTPVIRDEPSWWERWYMELGIGIDVIVPDWKTDRRRFGSDSNFSDHVGLGRKFGDEGRDEIERRAEHDSDGGIRQPKPGENWFQLRYMHWF